MVLFNYISYLILSCNFSQFVLFTYFILVICKSNIAIFFCFLSLCFLSNIILFCLTFIGLVNNTSRVLSFLFLINIIFILLFCF